MFLLRMEAFLLVYGDILAWVWRQSRLCMETLIHSCFLYVYGGILECVWRHSCLCMEAFLPANGDCASTVAPLALGFDPTPFPPELHFVIAVISSWCLRMYLMDKFEVMPDPWDNRIIVSKPVVPVSCVFGAGAGAGGVTDCCVAHCLLLRGLRFVVADHMSSCVLLLLLLLSLPFGLPGCLFFNLSTPRGQVIDSRLIEISQAGQICS